MSINLHDTRLTRWLPLVIVAAGILAYENSFVCPFIFDDSTVITANPRIHTLWPPWEAVLVPTRFVADLTFALNYRMAGLNPAVYHLTNVLIHICAGLLLFGVVRRTLALPRWGGRFDGVAPWLALLTALLWTVHPLQTESVTYVAQRIEALMGLCYLLTLYCFVRGVTSARPRRWLDAALASALVGMGTKEVMITAPVVVLLYDVLLVTDSWRAPFRSRGKFYVALALTWGVFAMLLLLSMAQAMAVGGLFYTALSRWRYALTQTQAIWRYLRLAVLPTGLCLDYQWPLARSLAEVWRPALGVLGLLGLTLFGLWRRHPAAFLGVWFFGILAPTSSVLPLPDAVFEHRMYLPLAAVIALVVIAAWTLLRGVTAAHARSRAVAVAVATAAAVSVAVTFVLLTRDRNLDYRSEEAMWREAIRQRPDAYRTYVALSTALIQQDRNTEAMTVVSNLLARLPDFSQVSAEELRRRWEEDSNTPCVPYAMAQNNLGVAALALGDAPTAMRCFAEASRVIPQGHWAYSNMGRALFLQGRVDEAIAQWQIALRLQPNAPQVHCFLALAHEKRRDSRKAVRHYKAALRLQPDFAFVRAQLAWLLATNEDPAVRNGAEAVELAQPLVRMSGGRSVRALDILAAAYAEAGRFDEAVATLERALRLAEEVRAGEDQGMLDKPVPPVEQGPGGLVGNSVSGGVPAARREALQQRLELYRQGRPYHEGPP